jgi:hypothetical protein
MEKYLDFLRYCLNDSLSLPESAKGINWMEMLAWAEEQAIVGIIYGGIQKAGEQIDIPFDALMEWVGYANQIEMQNKLLNKRCIEVSSYLKEQGFDICILKGQGNALMYPNPLLRISGDIDVWTRGKSIRDTILFAQKKNPGCKVIYYHVDYGLFKEIEVEIHYRPAFFNNLYVNRRLQKWFKASEDIQFGHERVLSEGDGKIVVPTWEFNVVFQLSHIYSHIIQEGIGLRQIIDYFYLLKSHTDNTESLSPDDSKQPEGKRTNLNETLKYLGLMELAGAVMWVLRDVLGLEEKYLIVAVDERRGRFLYDEIMQGGNFGQYDQRVKHNVGQLAKNLQRLRRDLRLFRFFPSECLWEPVFRVYHFLWRAWYKCRMF